MAVSGCMSLIAVSNVILLITGAVSLPLYFSFYGSEAAVRFSLLLCLHSCLLAAVPNVLVSGTYIVYLITQVTELTEVLMWTCLCTY